MAKKGHTNNPKGRPKGVPNKATATAKRLIAEFVGLNMADMNDLYQDIKREDPKKAFDVLFGALEYVIPKLQRTEAENVNLDIDMRDLKEDDLEIIKRYKKRLLDERDERDEQG